MATSSRSNQIYEYIVGMLKNGNLKPGDKLPTENDLSFKFGASRVSTRNALDKLVGMGVIYKKQGSGSYVSEINTTDTLNMLNPVLRMSDSEIIDILEFRRGFETSNIMMLNGKITDVLLSKLDNCFKEMERNKDSSLFHEYDYKFHQIIAEATENSFVIKISSLITDLLMTHQEHLYTRIGPTEGLNAHQRILESLHENDIEMAAIQMNRHMEHTLLLVMQTRK